MIDALKFISVLVGFVLVMEVVAWVTHKYVMHGWLWSWHKSHHEPRTGVFELNDLFGVVFSLPSIALIYIGASSNNAMALAAGLGILGYGLIYFFYHDILVHRRIDLGFRPKKGYFARIVQAHRLHHAVETKEDCVSFGFIFAPSPQRLKKMLAATDRAAMRAARGQSGAGSTTS